MTLDSSVGGGRADGERFVVGISIPAADHGWTAGVKYWAEQASKDFPEIDWIIEDAKGPDEQITDLQNMQSMGVDAVVILATESAPLTPIAEQLHDAGILIVNVDRGFTKPVADVFIEGDNKAFGRKSAQFIVDRLNGRGKIVILEGIPSTVNTDRVAAAMKVFKANPGIEIIAQDTGMWNREKADTVMQNMLVAHQDIDAIWASDDDMALGVENALRAAGRQNDVWILGGAGMKDVVKRVMDRDPLFPADITYPPSMIAVGVAIAASILQGGRENVLRYMPKHLVLDVDLITPDNAKDYYFPDSIY
ncbi:MAG: ABC transporter substrate-binding protein [Armatimonadetes bacterium]|nr:ABC transporter substrate-binding protein [Armatimonadota bacterium]